MATQPSSFLQQLALQTQVLANLQWLCELQILACIPLNGTVAFEEVADITDVPVDQLQRVVRLMTTAGFLCEPTSGQVAHTTLSAAFVTDPDLLDAALFLAQVAVPAAFNMPHTPRPFAVADRSQPWATSTPTMARGEGFDASQPKVQRQFLAYLTRGILDEVSAANEVLKLVDWEGLGSATVVDVNPPSTFTAATLAAVAPAVQFVVQTNSLSNGHSGLLTSSDAPPGGAAWMTYNLHPSVSSRISVQSRTAAVAQSVLGAAIYILRIPSPSPLLAWATVRSQTALELQAHLQVLRTQSTSRLIVTAVTMSQPGEVDHGPEAMVRLRDMALFQLANERQPTKQEIIELVTTIRDSAGGFIVDREIHAPHSAAIAFEVRYRSSNHRGRS